MHHVVPRARGGRDNPGNLVGLCRGAGTNECHDLIDHLTFDRGVRYDQLMEPGIEYVLGALNSVLSADELRADRKRQEAAD